MFVVLQRPCRRRSVSRLLLYIHSPLLLITPLSAFGSVIYLGGRALYIRFFFYTPLFALHHYQLIKWENRRKRGRLGGACRGHVTLSTALVALHFSRSLFSINADHFDARTNDMLIGIKLCSTSVA